MTSEGYIVDLVVRRVEFDDDGAAHPSEHVTSTELDTFDDLEKANWFVDEISAALIHQAKNEGEA